MKLFLENYDNLLKTIIIAEIGKRQPAINAWYRTNSGMVSERTNTSEYLFFIWLTCHKMKTKKNGFEIEIGMEMEMNEVHKSCVINRETRKPSGIKDWIRRQENVAKMMLILMLMLMLMLCIYLKFNNFWRLFFFILFSFFLFFGFELPLEWYKCCRQTNRHHLFLTFSFPL